MTPSHEPSRLVVAPGVSGIQNVGGYFGVAFDCGFLIASHLPPFLPLMRRPPKHIVRESREPAIGPRACPVLVRCVGVRHALELEVIE